MFTILGMLIDTIINSYCYFPKLYVSLKIGVFKSCQIYTTIRRLGLITILLSSVPILPNFPTSSYVLEYCMWVFGGS